MTERKYGGNAVCHLRQYQQAALLCIRYAEYARSIGCAVFMDEIQADARQAALLDAWWKDNTKGKTT